ncbi:MAG: biotin/lipoyl-binding protein, partial [Paracoccaceae bacterium]
MTAAEDMSVRGTICAGLAAISVLFLGFGSWATLTTITGAVVARGQVDVESSRLPVQHPTGGRIAELRVKEGQVVAAGALLMRLDSSEPSGELTAVEGRLAALLAERARLLAEQGSLLALKFPDDLADLARTRPEVPDLTSRQEQLFTDRRAAFQAEVE